MTTDIIDFNAELAALAKMEVSRERPATSSISFRSGVLQYNGTPLPGNKLDAIIIASTHANSYYEGKFDPDNVASPVCFSYNDNVAEMVPHPASSKPQADSCAVCPHNQFGSADNGRGKMCKNSRHLALIPSGTEAQDIAVAEVAVARLPVTSGKGFATYVQKLAALYSRPTLGGGVN